MTKEVFFASTLRSISVSRSYTIVWANRRHKEEERRHLVVASIGTRQLHVVVDDVEAFNLVMETSMLLLLLL